MIKKKKGFYLISYTCNDKSIHFLLFIYSSSSSFLSLSSLMLHRFVFSSSYSIGALGRPLSGTLLQRHGGGGGGVRYMGSMNEGRKQQVTSPPLPTLGGVKEMKVRDIVNQHLERRKWTVDEKVCFYLFIYCLNLSWIFVFITTSHY
jgi:hypothetical protein